MNNNWAEKLLLSFQSVAITSWYLIICFSHYWLMFFLFSYIIQTNEKGRYLCNYPPRLWKCVHLYFCLALLVLLWRRSESIIPYIFYLILFCVLTGPKYSYTGTGCLFSPMCIHIQCSYLRGYAFIQYYVSPLALLPVIS